MRFATRISAVAVLASVAGVFAPLAGQAQVQATQKSAQGDCQREAQRRGYAVLATRNYQQYKDGWSLELQARDKSGRVSWGSCFVETRTGDVSLYGFGWGSSDSGSNSFDFYCASVDFKYRECQLPVDGIAKLVKTKSDASCNEGRDWGQRSDRVWVDHGCRANFTVTRGGGNSGQQQRAEMQCRNQATRERVEVLTVAPAVRRGSYWETTVEGSRDNWYVRSTCRFYPATSRAEFNYPGGSGSTVTGEPVVAERACVNEAERQGLRVVGQERAQPIRGGYAVNLSVRRGNQPAQPGYCTYMFSTGRAELRY
jgi:hypothetical protein